MTIQHAVGVLVVLVLPTVRPSERALGCSSSLGHIEAWEAKAEPGLRAACPREVLSILSRQLRGSVGLGWRRHLAILDKTEDLAQRARREGVRGPDARGRTRRVPRLARRRLALPSTPPPPHELERALLLERAQGRGGDGVGRAEDLPYERGRGLDAHAVEHDVERLRLPPSEDQAERARVVVYHLHRAQRQEPLRRTLLRRDARARHVRGGAGR
mmetsp:Transcript_32330/g.103433  ORF Transcript_32330/g.103433 Transcript_32330/m.103433 type:complete len:215 (-) Transcript_32330:390-1034(-)